MSECATQNQNANDAVPNTVPAEPSDAVTQEPKAQQEPAMSYMDDKDEPRKEPGCPRCIRRYSFTEAHRAIIESALEAAYRIERYLTDEWHKVAECYGSHDHYPALRIEATAIHLDDAPGPFAMSCADNRIILGALLACLAANIDLCAERKDCIAILTLLSDFASHLDQYHRCKGERRVDLQVTQRLDEPLFFGSFTVRKAIEMSPDLAGKKRRRSVRVV